MTKCTTEGCVSEQKTKGLCKRCYDRARRAVKGDEIKAAKKKYYQENRVKIEAHRKEWYEKNVGVISTTRREKYKNNPEPMKAYQRQYRKENPAKIKHRRDIYCRENVEKIKARKRHGSTGVSPSMVSALLTLQDNRCAICDADLRALPTKLVHADHCHTTKKPRGMLCGHCNRGLGGFMDNPAILLKAVEYLKNPPAAIAALVVGD